MCWKYSCANYVNHSNVIITSQSLNTRKNTIGHMAKPTLTNKQQLFLQQLHAHIYKSFTNERKQMHCSEHIQLYTAHH